MTPSPSPADLSLAAIRYLTDEMTASESVQFEQLLESDAAAQQALVEAVKLAAALQSAATVRATAPSPHAAMEAPYGRRRWTAALAMSGCGIVAATLFLALWFEPAPFTRAEQQSAAVAAVSAWAELSDREESGGADDVMFVVEDEVSAADVIPDWLMAALEVDSVGSPDGNGRTDDGVNPLDDEI